MVKRKDVRLKRKRNQRNNFLGLLLMSKPGKSLRNLCKKLGVRLTVKRGKKRVYKSVAVLKRQCANKKKKKKVKKVVKRRRRFGMAPPPIRLLKALEEQKVQEELYSNIKNKLGGGQHEGIGRKISEHYSNCLLYTSPSPRD